MATATQQRAQAAAYMKSRKKKNTYTQGAKRKYFFGYPDNKPGNTKQKGYSDCSAAARAAIMAAAGIDIGSNTSAQINNRKKGIVVHETDGFYPDESKLLPSDCLYFKGNTSHPLDVGHVEMYTGKNECTGHGSGKGPTVKNLKTYCKGRATKKRRYFMAIRWIKDDGSEKAPAATAAPASLKKGSKGAEVKTLQQNLLTLGYSLGSYGADGSFGAATEKAVKAFQRDHGLEVDGICGANTRKAIEAALQNKASAPPRKVRIVNGDCNARTAPSTKGKILGVAKKGQVFNYQGQTAENGWNLIEFNGQNAWVSGRYSRLED